MCVGKWGECGVRLAVNPPYQEFGPASVSLSVKGFPEFFQHKNNKIKVQAAYEIESQVAKVRHRPNFIELNFKWNEIE